MELEIEVPDDSCEDRAERILSAANTGARPVLFAETDGSLDHGFEVITQPMGLDRHAQLWRTLLVPALVAGLKSHNTSTCGLHVHVSRAGLSPFTLAKAVVFINDPKNRALIQAIARRYDGINENRGRSFSAMKAKTLAHGHQDDGDRYQSVNLCNRKTVEFRIFRGSLKRDAVMAAIEFCQASIEFCAVTAPAHLNSVAFLAFLNTPAMHADTRTLRPYLTARGMVTTPAQPSAPLSATVAAEKTLRRNHAGNHVGKFTDCIHCAPKVAALQLEGK